jgi:hypothetical protein
LILDNCHTVTAAARVCDKAEREKKTSHDSLLSITSPSVVSVREI